MSFLLCGSERERMDKENQMPKMYSQTGTMMGPEMHQEITRPENVTLCIKRGKNGYGFSVTGSCPAKIRRVSEDSVSYLAGLRQGDSVIRINGQNVAKSVADSIAKIVRQSEKQIILDIERHVPQSGYKDEQPVYMDMSQMPDHPKSRTSTRPALSTINEIPSDKIPEGNKFICQADIEPLPRNTEVFPRHSSSESLNSYQSCSSGSNSDNLIDIGDWESPHSPKSGFPQLNICFQELSDSEQNRQAAVQKLVSCEEEFLAQMQFGIQQYSRPLRHRLVSPHEHVTLFQNVEKLVSLSEYHLYKLKEEGIAYSDINSAKFIDIIGSIYVPKLLMMREVYEQYCNGIKNAFRLLAELQDFEEFESFLLETQREPGQPTISGFIQRPLQHMKDLVLTLQKILELTPLEHQDMDNLTQVVDTIRKTCNKINESNTRRSKSMTSLCSKSTKSSRKSSRSKSGSSTGSGTASVLSSDSNSSVESSVDCAVMDIQRRLIFCEHVQAFQLATATRHMIYSGELMHVDGLMCTKLFAVLMSDLLLLTKEQEDGHLLVLDHPILLEDIIETDFRTPDTMDFMMGAEVQVDDEWCEAREITLRAPNLEQKYTWKNILHQRMETCKLQKQYYNPDNII